MAEYIEREAVLSTIWKTSAEHNVFFPAIMLDAIKSIPAADVRPVVRGKWERLSHRPGYGYRCTECGAIYNKRKGRLNFCPNCGAEMRGEADEKA